jgi:hypothetical protein
MRTCRALLPGLLLAFMLQGCLFNRVLETRYQLCEQQPSSVRVLRQQGSPLRVVFDAPTLTERDVVWIAGHDPTEVAGTGTARTFVYEARPIQRPHERGHGVVVRLSFVPVDGESRLAVVEIPDKFNAIVSPALLDAAVRVVCKSQFGIVPPSATFDLAGVDRHALPRRTAITALLGAPIVVTEPPSELAYQYCLVPCVPGAPAVSNVRFSFDDGGSLRRVAGRYFRYKGVADLEAAKAVVTLEFQ